ncbi:hypothetical protein [Flavobacterium xinjiangense]|uniref:Uncharacterized protein n=1 Tax=Flavobacterium xinjiangense TaxID=178356 RepID=A0A1M7PPQ9_9FLAO|nr:hypothetical protein [Flavobacterium xinjiangense]SHN19146.1 hypothetical protein SAMN05216269_12045 [Flavobacterium xinjiangense]
MNKITFEEYKNAIRIKYEVSKIEEVSGILLNPTPAQLRNLCLMRLDHCLTKTDGSVFRMFFNVKEEEKVRKEIENFDIGKFKPIISFLKEEKDSDNVTRIELAAILVDFNPRPYSKYLLNGKIIEKSNLDVTSLVEEKESDVDYFSEDKREEEVVETKHNDRVKKKAVIVLTVFLSLFFMGYSVKNMIFPEKECMKWDGDHYEAVDCKNEKLGIGNVTSVVVLNEDLLSFKKIEVSTNTIFFKKGKPIVWYGKSFEGNYEYFNQPGLHPETEKTLKPISEYIIKKYLHK